MPARRGSIVYASQHSRRRPVASLKKILKIMLDNLSILLYSIFVMQQISQPEVLSARKGICRVCSHPHSISLMRHGTCLLCTEKINGEIAAMQLAERAEIEAWQRRHGVR